MNASTRSASRWKGVGHPPTLRSLTYEPAPHKAYAYADENPKAHLLQGEAYPVACGLKLLFGHRQGQEERQEGHRQAVVEPGLDVQGLAYADWDAGIVHDRLPERSVGRREDGTYDGCLPESQIRKQQRRQNGPERDCEGHPYAQEAQGQSLILAQSGEVGPSCVGEQHDRKSDLGHQEHGVIVEFELNQTEGRRTEDYA